MIKDIRINKYFFIVLLSILLIGVNIALAGESFQNSLMRMDFSKTSLGSIKINLYTGKLFSEGISVNKKNDCEYVILLPETSNSMTSNPILNPVSDIIRGVSVKTQEYEGQIKGYTKITIRTIKPVEVIPQVQVINVSDYKLSENDYNELLAQSSKKTVKSVKKQEIKSSVKIKKGTEESASKPKLTKTITKTEPKKTVQKTNELPIAKKVQKTKELTKISQKPSLKKSTINKPKIVEQKELASKPIEKTITPIQQNENVATTPVIEKNISTPTPVEVPKTVNVISTHTKIKNFLAQYLPPSVIEQLSNLRQYEPAIKNNLYPILGVLALLLMLLLVAARKNAKKHKQQKDNFELNLDEKPNKTPNYMDKINENMTWKEKYQTFVDASEQSPPVEEKTPINEASMQNNIDSSEELNELFGMQSPTDNLDEEVKSEPIQKEIQQPKYNYNSFEKELLEENAIPQNELSQDEDILDQNKLDELFGENEDFFGEENNFMEESFLFEETEAIINNEINEKQEIEEEEVEIIKSEFTIDDKKGFYLVDFQNSSALVGHINDDIFVLKRFDTKINAPLQARLDERKGNSINYMTRVGNFKALVEVTPKNMNLLIEL